MLQPVHPDIFTATVPHNMLFFHLGARMTVVRLADQQLFVHSPIPLTKALQQALADLGTVAYIVAPNAFHHLHITPYLTAFPDARLYGPKALTLKREDLKFTRFLDEEGDFPWSEELAQEMVQGANNLSETAFFHKKSGTLILCDLIVNVHKTPSLITRFYLWFFGIWKKPGVSKLIKLLTVKKGAFTKSMIKIKKWPVQRIIVAHGEVIEDDAKAVLEACY